MGIRKLFPGQQDNETIYLVIRKHWFFLFTQIFIWLLFVAVLYVFDFFGPKFLPGMFQDPYLGYIAVFKNLYVTLLVVGLFIIWTLYYINIQIITNERVVEISQQGLFDHVISELYLVKIEDVTGETRGIMQTIFGYGDVYIQTAGKLERFVFSQVPQPEKIEKLILDLSETLQKKAAVSTQQE